MNKPRRILTVLAGTLLLGGLLAGGGRWLWERAAGSQSTRKSTETRGEDLRDDHRCALPLGSRHGFDFRVTARSTGDGTANLVLNLGNGPAWQAAGRMDWQVSAVSPERAQVAVRLRPESQDRLPEGSLALELTPDCAFSRVGMPARWTPGQRNAVRSLLQSLEVRTARQPGQARWSAEHADATGRYAARYQAVAGGVRAHREPWHDQWTRAKGATWTLVDGTLAATWRPLGWVATLTSQARTRLTVELPRAPGVAGSAPLATVDLQWQTEIHARAADGAVPHDFAGLQWTPLHVAPEAETAPLPLATGRPPEDDATWAHLDTRGLLQALADHRKLHGRHKVGLAARRIATWLKRHPDGAAALLAGMRDGSIDEELRSVLFLGLQKAGTPQAHTALVDAARDTHLHLPDRLRGIAALSEFSQPTEATLQALSDLARADNEAWGEVENSALYGVGVLAAHGRTAAPELVPAVLDDLVLRLDHPAGLRELDAALEAVGNAGDVTLLPKVQPHLHADQPGLRMAALQALRQMPMHAIQGEFATLLAQAASPAEVATIATVYAEAARQEGQHLPSGLVSQAVAALAGQTNPAARKALVELLAASTDPAAHQALVDAMRRERDGDVLVVLGKYVAAEEVL